MDIKTFQTDFVNAIFGGDKAPAIDYVIGDDTLTAEQRFGIYSGSVHGILTQVLGVMFPICKSLVGDEFFDNMSKIFIDKYPPNTSFFSEYGSKLPEFIRTFEHVKDIPYLHDVARLEWIRQIIWHEEEPKFADFSQLSTLPEEQQFQIIFKLSERMRLIKSNYRIDELWFAHQPDNNLDLESIDIDQSVKLVIRRDKNTIKISIFSDNEGDDAFWDFLYAISKENTLEQLAEQFGDSLSIHLNQAIQGAWIQSFSTST